MPKNVKERSQGTKFFYLSRDVVSSACSEIIENILLKAYEEENPFRDEGGLIIVNSRTIVSDGVGSLHSIATLSDDKAKDVALQELQYSPENMTVVRRRSTGLNFIEMEIANPFPEGLVCKKWDDTVVPDKSITEEILEEYDGLEGMSISSELVFEGPVAMPRKTVTFLSPESTIELVTISDNPETSSTGSTASRDASVQNSLVTLCQTVPLEDRTVLTDPQAQGDIGAPDDNTLYTDSLTATNVNVNFVLYAKLFAILLTVNTLIFFKTMVWTVFWKIFDIYMRTT